jgi:hypothetical protein
MPKQGSTFQTYLAITRQETFEVDEDTRAVIRDAEWVILTPFITITYVPTAPAYARIHLDRVQTYNPDVSGLRDRWYRNRAKARAAAKYERKTRHAANRGHAAPPKPKTVAVRSFKPVNPSKVHFE